jgi:hypothetical protein
VALPSVMRRPGREADYLSPSGVYVNVLICMHIHPHS